MIANAPINAKPWLPPLGHRWGLVQLMAQKTHPLGISFKAMPHNRRTWEMWGIIVFLVSESSAFDHSMV